jgi:PAS domain S-box-containing protein
VNVISGPLLEIFGRTSDGMIAVDVLSRIVAWNPAATDLLGYATDEVLGRCCADVLRWRDRHGNLVCSPRCAIKERAARGLIAESQDVLATSKSERVIWLSVSTVVLPPTLHPVCRLVHFLREVSFTPGQEVALNPEPHARPEANNGHRERLQALTPREREVLALLAQGVGTVGAADELSVSTTTVRNHVARILAKLEVHSRIEAIALALRAKYANVDASVL